MKYTKSKLEKVINNPAYGLFTHTGVDSYFFYDEAHLYTDPMEDELVILRDLEGAIREGKKYVLTTPIELFE